MTDVASTRSTSTMSSLKALLPKQKSGKKEKTGLNRPTIEEKALRSEVTATYMSMMR